VLVFARGVEAARSLGAAFAAGEVGKRYLALVRGVPPEELEIDHPLPAGEDRRGPRVAATTVIRRLEVIGRYALVEARPRTGRLHQIRRHLKHVSCPILGDVNYGKGAHNRACRERYGLSRLFLHCVELRVPHPRGGELVVGAPLPAELEAVLEAMRRAPPG
jgi:tRNA pseudouridine65 synthase